MLVLITGSEAGEGAEVCVILQNSVFVEKIPPAVLLESLSM